MNGTQQVKVEDVQIGDKVLFHDGAGGPWGTVLAAEPKVHPTKVKTIIKSSKGEVVNDDTERKPSAPPRKTVALNFGPHSTLRLDVGETVTIQERA